MSFNLWSLDASAGLETSEGNKNDDAETEYRLTRGEEGGGFCSSDFLGSNPDTSQFHRFFCSAIRTNPKPIPDSNRRVSQREVPPHSLSLSLDFLSLSL